MYVFVEGKKEEKGFFGGVVESLVAHILEVVQVGGAAGMVVACAL